jgi:hypothetical protein
MNAEDSTHSPIAATLRRHRRKEDASSPSRRDFLKASAAGIAVLSQGYVFGSAAEGRGGQGPDLLRSPVVLDDDKGKLIGPVIQNGRPSKRDASLFVFDGRAGSCHR